VNARRVLRRGGLVRIALGFLAFALGAVELGTPVASAQSDDLVQLMLLEGDSVSVRFPTPICASKGLEPGAVIEAEVADSKLISSMVAIAEGAPVKLEVAALERNGRKGKPGHLKLEFVSVIAVDGAEIFFRDDEVLERHGSKKHLVKKILTLFLIKGGDACIRSDERFFARFRTTSAVYVPQP
jgi:hypothetical protein